MIDLDSNATTRLLPEVLEAMMPWLEDGYANPSGSYKAAKKARNAINDARAQVADLIGASPEEITFTSGGTESINTALHSLHSLTGHGTALSSAIEHSAVLKCIEHLDRQVEMVGVDHSGRLDLDAFEASLPNAAFVSIMGANNETGVTQPLVEVIERAKSRQIPVHSDTVQLIGKLPLDVKEAPLDLASLSAHKFHGPKGIGALYIRNGLKFQSLLQGGGQESGRRSGTENTASIVGMGAAAVAAKSFLESADHSALKNIRDHFQNSITSEIDGVTLNGNIQHRLPNTTHLSFDGCDAAGLLILLDEAGIQCSAGSACMTGKQKPSHVQLAMDIPEDQAKSSLRFGFSRFNTMEDAEAAVQAVKQSVEKLRRIQGPGVGPVTIYTP